MSGYEDNSSTILEAILEEVDNKIVDFKTYTGDCEASAIIMFPGDKSEYRIIVRKEGV